jgi:DNA-binding MarR family transcriptional regulator
VPSQESDQAHSHPALGLDDVVHQKTRLALLTVLDEAGQADFPYLKRLLDLTDGNLGRHLDILAEQGLIEITKGYAGRRPRTWATITPKGERALTAEMSSLATLLHRFQGITSRTPRPRDDTGANS